MPDLSGIGETGGQIASNMFGGLGGGVPGAGAADAVAPAAESAGLGLPSVGGYLLPAAGIAAGGYGLYDLMKNRGQGSEGMNAIQGGLSGAATGAGIGSFLGPGGTAIGAGIGGALGLGGGLLAGGAEHPEMAARGKLANELDKSGIAPDLQKGQYNIDPSQNNLGTVTGQLVGAVNPAAAIAAAGVAQSPEEFAKLRNDTAGMMANKLGTTPDTVPQLKALYDRMGGRDAVYSKIVQLGSTGMLPKPEADAALAAIDMIYGVSNPQAGGEDQKRFNQFQQSQQLAGTPGAQPTPTPTPGPAPTPLAPTTQIPTGNVVPTGNMPPPAQGTRPQVLPGQNQSAYNLAARKGNVEPIDYRIMDLDPRFAGVFQKGSAPGGKQMGRSIFQVG
jgi:hypothetical protein